MTYEQVMLRLKQLFAKENKSVNFDVLKKHKCSFLFYKEKGQQFFAEKILNMAKVKERLSACSTIFSQTRIPYAVVKGPVLSVMSYTDPYIRVSGDLDILVSPNHLEDLSALLTKSGFVQARVVNNEIKAFTRKEKIFQGLLTHQVPTYVKKTDNSICPFVFLDVNTSILFGESLYQPDVSKILQQTEKIDIGGVLINKLISELDLIFVCLHHYKDIHSIYLISRGSFTLDLFCDIVFYIENQSLNYHKFLKYCQELKVGKYIYIMLYYSSILFPTDKIISLLSMLETEKDDSLIDCYGLTEDERKKWNIDFCSRVIHPNLSGYISQFLTDKDKEKIKINQSYM